jgi:RimJ/RimL family protein N-acetyltransferase
MVTIKTERLVLREFTQDDFEPVQRYASNSNVVRYMEWGHNTERDTKRFIQDAIKKQVVKPRENYELAITLDSQLIGGTGIIIKSRNDGEAEIGYCIDEPYWGKGVGSEVAEALIKHCFEELDVHRVIATCDSENIGSYRVMEKNGMTREGLLRENKLIKGRRRDTLIYSILTHEWTPE